MEDKGSVRDLYSKRVVERIVVLPCELSIPSADPSWSKDQCEIECPSRIADRRPLAVDLDRWWVLGGTKAANS